MKFEFSAGGIVVRQRHVLVAQHSQHHGWVFPKGLIGDTIQNESKENTAIREVMEETGIKGEIIQPLTPIIYWYQFNKEKRKKTVYYYIMKYICEDKSKKDREMEQIEWLPFEQVEERLTYPSDKKVWSEAKDEIRNKFSAKGGSASGGK